MLWPIISGKGIGGKQTRHASIINRLYSSSTEVHEPKGRRRTFSLRLQCFSSSRVTNHKKAFSLRKTFFYTKATDLWLVITFLFPKNHFAQLLPFIVGQVWLLLSQWDFFFKQCAFMNFFWPNLALGNTRNWTLPDFGDMPCTVVFLVSNLA